MGVTTQKIIWEPGSDTMSDQVVTPQPKIGLCLFLEVGLHYIHEGETIHFISQWMFILLIYLFTLYSWIRCRHLEKK